MLSPSVAVGLFGPQYHHFLYFSHISFLISFTQGSDRFNVPFLFGPHVQIAIYQTYSTVSKPQYSEYSCSHSVLNILSGFIVISCSQSGSYFIITNMASWCDKWKIANDLMMMYNAYMVKQVGSTNHMYCGILTSFNKPVRMQRKSSCSFVLNQSTQEGLHFAEVERELLCEKSIYCNHPFSLSHLGVMILISVSYNNVAE